MGESDTTEKENFYLLMARRRYDEAYDLLVENPSLIDNMEISQLTEHYQKFKTQVPVRKIPKLVRMLTQRVLGEDYSYYSV